MYKIATLNKISPQGLKLLTDDYKLTDDISSACGIVVRSQDMHSMRFSDKLLGIARAGVGVNNIPIDACSEKGIIVFNTPGANANAVKEMVIAGMLLASRNIIAGSYWANSLEGDITQQVEKGKSRFKGQEIKGKTIGVIGLGGIGVPVVNACVQLGMNVIGYDAYLSVKNALHLSKHAKVVDKLEDMLPLCDYLTVHVHANEETKGMINEDILNRMKDGSVLLNYARDSIVDVQAVDAALKSGKLYRYVTDFPTEAASKLPNIIMTPHLGASTDDAEDNCAEMAIEELMDYIENGNIRRSVNFPDVDMGKCRVSSRLALIHRNMPSMISKISQTLTANISDMTNRSRGNFAYTLLDLDERVPASDINALSSIDGMIRVRLIKNS
ncbi:MAG: 3-phosphoglycerate dehydrogenase family protein [Anaerovoracaceae bacterium]